MMRRVREPVFAAERPVKTMAACTPTSGALAEGDAEVVEERDADADREAETGDALLEADGQRVGVCEGDRPGGSVRVVDSTMMLGAYATARYRYVPSDATDESRSRMRTVAAGAMNVKARVHLRES